MADTLTWLDYATFALGVVGAATGISAFVRSGSANRAAGVANTIAAESKDEAAKANDIAVEALQVSRESAVSARESAAAAQVSADHERSALEIQRMERHEALRPDLPTRLRVRPKRGRAGEFLETEIEVAGDYRVEAEMIAGDSVSRGSMDAVLHKGRTVQVFVEQLAPNQHEPTTNAIKFRFWPPTATDGVDPWQCGCGAPEAADGGRGHWERTVPIYRQPPVVVRTLR